MKHYRGILDYWEDQRRSGWPSPVHDDLARLERHSRSGFYTWSAVAALAFLLFMLTLSSCTITTPVAACGPVKASKTGQASANVVLGFSFGADASVARAAAAGGVTDVHTVDLRTLNVLGLYKRHTCIVRGE